MTVTGNQPPSVYTCDGIATAYTIGFPYLSASDLVATKTVGGVTSTLILGTDYTITAPVAPSTGTLKLTSGGVCPNGSTLSISRSTPLTQPQSFRTGAYNGPAVEQAVDRLEMQAQEMRAKEVADLGVVNNTVAAFNSSGAAIGSTTSVLATGSTTPRTLAARFADEVNVKDFGATGNNVTDDTLAIQAAITAAKAISAWVVFPPGTYKVTAELTVGGTFRVRGTGTISSTVATGSLFVANADLLDFVIRDVKLTTTRNDLINRGGALFYSDGFNIDGGLIDNVRFDTASSFSDSVLMAAQAGKTLKNVTFRNNIVLGTSAGFEILNHADATVRVSGFTITGNKFVNNGLKDDQVAGFAISLSGAHSGFTVSGNEITGYPYAGIEVVAPTAGGTFALDYKIYGNTLTSCGRGIIFDASHSTDRMTRISVVGNTVISPRFLQRFNFMADSEIANNHIELISAVTSTDRQPEIVSFRDSDRMVVTGNYINLDVPAAEAAKPVVTFIDWNSSKFAENRVRSTGASTIRLDGTTTTVADNFFSGNKFVHAPNGALSDPIQFQGAGAVRNVFNGNTIETSNTLDYISATNSNVARNTTFIRSDTGAISTKALLAVTVTGNTDLSLKSELRFIRLQGTPGAGFTVTLPPRDAVYTISNASGQTATVGATSGAVAILTGNTATITVQAGVAAAL